MQYRIGQGYDVHALGEGIPMRLCGVDVPSPKGFVAHSDGDVAIHALCDAILGALALGDIGKLFPDTAPEYAGIDSRILLGKVYSLAFQMGFVLGNADITIALQSPKIGTLVPRMRRSLATVLGVEESRISVKATTTEKLGFVGNGQGCEVWAVVLMQKGE